MNGWKRGDIVLADLGYGAKERPALVISIQNADSQRNMNVVAPLTTVPRGGECEIGFAKPQWLTQTSVVNLIGIVGVDNAKILRRLGPFPGNMRDVENGLRRMLGL